MAKNYQVSLLSSSEDLKRKLYDVTYFNSVDKITSIGEICGEITIIDDSIISLNDLLKQRDSITSNYIFYKLSIENFKFSTKSILKSKNIFMLQPYMTNENIVEFICSEVIKHYRYKVNKNIITFYGADSKVGTTQIAQCVAESLVDKSYAKVSLVFLDGEPSTEYFDRTFHNNIDTIKIKLISELATEEEVFDIAENVKDNLYVIEGTKSILYRKEYQPEHIAYLLNILAASSDLVIVDAGNAIDRAMAIAALTSTQHRYLVTTQNANCLRNYLKKKPILERLLLDDFQIIVNKFIPDGSLFNIYDIAKEYGHPSLVKVDYSPYSMQAEYDHKPLIYYNDKGIDKSIEKLVDMLIDQTNLSKKEVKTKKRFFLMQGVK